jgi:hypothetical protein
MSYKNLHSLEWYMGSLESNLICTGLLLPVQSKVSSFI